MENINKKYKKFQISEKSVIEIKIKEIVNILKFSYRNIGGFLCYKSENNLISQISLMTGFYDEQQKICVLSLYKDNMDGYKLFGCGTAHGSKEEKELLKSIIKEDVEKYTLWHWAEVSGVLEHWFKKYNGYPIPSDFAQIALSPHKLSPLKDGFHYKRDINHVELTKIMYGFKDHAFFDDIVAKYENYFELRKKINSSDTITEKLEPEIDKVNVETLTLNDISELVLPFAKMVKMKCYYLTENMVKRLNLLSNILGSIESDDKIIVGSKKILKILEEKGELLQSHSFAPIEKYIVSPAL